jgi:DNA polymerase III sliding clamp (beta) subunit (PCNA family)
MSNLAPHIVLPVAELKPALMGLGKIIGKRTTLPVLSNIKIERTKDGWVALTATDLDRCVTVRLEQPGEGEPIALLIPYEDLQAVTKSCDRADTLTVEPGDNNYAAIKYPVGTQTIEHRCASLPVAEFPETPKIKGNAIALPDRLRQAIHEALQCASTDETRIIINGAYLDVSDPKCQHVVGTDGRHLFSSNSFTLPLAKSLLIPSHRFLGWKEFNADGEWQLRVGVPEHTDVAAPFQISSRRWRYISRQIDGNYPNWRQVVSGPNNYATSIEFAAEAVQGVLQTIGRMPCDDTVNHAIGLGVKDGKFALLGRAPGAAEHTRIEIAEAKAEGRDIRIFLNRHLLTKALEFGLTRVELIDALSALRFCQGGRQMIVMPTRPNLTPAPAPAPQPTPTTPPATAAQSEPPAPEQPEERTHTMPDKPNGQTNGHTTGAKSAETKTDEPKAALDTALAQIEIVRGDFRNAIAGLNKLAEALKQAQRESKASDREIASVRQTLRQIQAVRI